MGITLGLAVGVMLAHGRWTELGGFGVIAAALGSGLRLLLAPSTRSILLPLLALMFLTRAALAVLIHVGSLATPLGGFVPGDDREYYLLSRAFVLWLQGEAEPPFVPPYWAGRTYLFGTWVYLESGIFLLFGPHVLIPILANAAFGTLATVLIYDMARRIFGPRPALLAALLVGFYPSLVLWSSLNLKEALTLLLIAVVFWSVLVLQMSGRLMPLLGVLIPLLLLQTLRAYIFTGLALISPLGVMLAPRLRIWERLRASGSIMALSAFLLWANSAGLELAPGLLTDAQRYRVGMAAGARTAIEGAAPVSVVEGTTFVVTTASPAAIAEPTATSVAPTGPAASPSAAATTCPATMPARLVYVPTHARIVVGPPSSPEQTPLPEITTVPITLATTVPTTVPASPSPFATTIPTTVPTTIPAVVATGSVVYVCPRDIVVVGAPGTTPAPPEARIRLEDAGRNRGIDIAPQAETDADLTLRTIAYLPRGLLYSLFAPWPWLSDRPLDLLAVPEMLLWYAALAAALVTIWRDRARWRSFALPVLFVAGLLFVLALVEGNWGTLFRHRSMVIPFVLLFAAPTFLWLAEQRGELRGRLLGGP